MPICFFKVIRKISKSHWPKTRRFQPKLGVSGLELQFEFTDAYDMMHKAWKSIEDVPYFKIIWQIEMMPKS